MLTQILWHDVRESRVGQESDFNQNNNNYCANILPNVKHQSTGVLLQDFFIGGGEIHVKPRIIGTEINDAAENKIPKLPTVSMF